MMTSHPRLPAHRGPERLVLRMTARSLQGVVLPTAPAGVRISTVIKVGIANRIETVNTNLIAAIAVETAMKIIRKQLTRVRTQPTEAGAAATTEKSPRTDAADDNAPRKPKTQKTVMTGVTGHIDPAKSTKTASQSPAEMTNPMSAPVQHRPTTSREGQATAAAARIETLRSEETERRTATGMATTITGASPAIAHTVTETMSGIERGIETVTAIGIVNGIVTATATATGIEIEIGIVTAKSAASATASVETGTRSTGTTAANRAAPLKLPQLMRMVRVRLRYPADREVEASRSRAPVPSLMQVTQLKADGVLQLAVLPPLPPPLLRTLMRQNVKPAIGSDFLRKRDEWRVLLA